MKTTQIENIICYVSRIIRKFAFTLLIVLLTINSFGASITWTGGTNTDWKTASNWSGSVVPGTADVVTISAGIFNCVLDTVRTINQLTISDSLDLNGYTLTVTSNSTFNSGAYVNNGTLTIYESTAPTTTTFTSGTIAATLNVTASIIKFSGTAFTGVVTAVKKGTSSSTGNGGCSFSSTVTLIDSSSGNWTFANSSSDSWADKVVLKETSSGTIFFAHNSTGNSFSKSVTFTTTGTGIIYCDEYGSSTFHDSIIVNSTRDTSAIRFGFVSGISTLDTSIIVIGATGFNSTATTKFTSLYLNGIHQNDSTKTISLTTTGTSEVQFGSGSIWKGAVTVSVPNLRLNGSRFFGVVNMTYTANNTDASTGGCYFGNSTTLSRNATGGGIFSIGTTIPDTFNTAVTIKNESHGYVSIVNAIFKNKVILKNQNTESSSDRFLIGTAGTCVFKDSVTLDNTTSGMNFGNTGGSVSFDSSSYLYIPSTYTGNLTFKNTFRHGSHAVSVPFQSNTGALDLDTNSTWDAPFTANVQTFQLNGSKFNNSFYLKKTGVVTDSSKGGNVFNGTCELVDSNSHTPPKTTWLASNYADDYNGSVTFKQWGTCTLNPSYRKNSTFAGNLTVDGSSAIAFGSNGGKIIFDGSGVQTISKTGSYNPTVKNVDVNKAGGYLKLSVPLAIDTLKLIKGIVITDTTNIISIPLNGLIQNISGAGGTDSGYVHGPIKKTGTDSFIFATGDTALHTFPYHPIKFTTGPASGDVYEAQYFAHGSGFADSDTLDSTQVSTCEYWNLKRDVGTTGVKVRLGYTNCIAGDPARAVVMDYYNGAWYNEGNSAYGGASVDAADTSLIQAGTSQPITVGIHPAINVAVISPSGATVNSAHVKKWEKYEVAIQLPQSYVDCINSYTAHRVDTSYHGSIDKDHDLNPYADDSLILKMVLTNPVSNRQITQYGFFMRDAGWISDASSADFKISDTTNSLSDYHVHFRYAPDTLSSTLWEYSIYIAAPFTKVTGASTGLLPVYLGPYFFTCDSLQPDNHGFLKVNPSNNRYLVFDDGTTFFGIGDIVADFHKYFDYDGDTYSPKMNIIYNRYYKFDHDDWINTLRDLRDGYANYECLFFFNRTFCPEYEYLGWYDKYDTVPFTCGDFTGISPAKGNRQWNLWAFDKIIDEAHADGIYLQTVLDAQFPHFGGEEGQWGGSPYVRQYVYPTGTSIGAGKHNGPYAHPEYYWNGAGDTTTQGALYYWKRQYKYMMARWGYSPNMAVWQILSENDQILAYRSDTAYDCSNDYTYYSRNTNITGALNTFLDTVVGYVKNNVDVNHHLYSTSYTPRQFAPYFRDPSGVTIQDYYANLNSPNIDIMDMHFYTGDLYGNAPRDQDVNLARYYIEEDMHGSDSLQLGFDKPFHFGEGSNYLKNDSVFDPHTNHNRYETITDLYDNYDVTFHNEIWATSFMNSMSCLLSWSGSTVHWWPNGLPHAPVDTSNIFQSGNFSNVLDSTNHLDVNAAGSPTVINQVNKKIYYNYKMLSDYFVTSGIDLNDNFTVHYAYHDDIPGHNHEVYYMVSSDGKAAYGWVHNVNKYWKNAYYYDVADEKYYYCNESTFNPITEFRIGNLDLGGPYDIEFYPTRMGGQALPENHNGKPLDLDNFLTIPFTSVTLGCDSLTADFAFKVTQYGSGHRMAHNNDTKKTEPSKIGFGLSPNPNDGFFKLIIPKEDAEHYSIWVYDAQSKLIFKKENLNVQNFNLNLGACSKGIYFVQVISTNQSSFKKVVVQ